MAGLAGLAVAAAAAPARVLLTDGNAQSAEGLAAAVARNRRRFAAGAAVDGGALVWDREVGDALETRGFFTSPQALEAATAAPYCRALNALRTERRGSIDADGSLGECPKLSELTLLIGSSNGETFDRLADTVAPALAEHAQSAGRIELRCWSIGCASGCTASQSPMPAKSRWDPKAKA